MLMIPRFIFLLILLHAVCPQWSLAILGLPLNRLKLNGDKTELLIIGSKIRPGLQFPPVALTDGSVILPSKYARNIGVTFDSVLNFERRITDICKSCYFNICNIYRIRKFLSTIKPTKILVNAFVTSRLDNCNSLLYGLPCGLLHKLQLTSTELCSSLNSGWLQVWPHHAIMTQEASLADRCTSSTFKLLLITFKALNNLAPCTPQIGC